MAVEIFRDMDMALFAQRLRHARQDVARLTQATVAWRANLNPSHYSELEGGHRAGVHANTVYVLCQVLGVSADYLLGLAEHQDET